MVDEERAPDATVSLAEFARITEALTARGVTANCPACASAGLQVVGYAVQPVQEHPTEGGDRVGTSFPTVVLVCPTCGYTRAHSLVALGLEA